jgi:hypothetical protein
MEPTGDELAGIVDLFGALSRAELERALDELAFKRDVETPAPETVDAAVASYHLVVVDEESGLLAVGPTAFPTVPEGGRDLPHILDVPDREVDRGALVEAVERRFRADAATAVEAGDDERIAELLDLSYDLDAWGAVDLSGARERLADSVDG